jgi:hypothetical protein
LKHAERSEKTPSGKVMRDRKRISSLRYLKEKRDGNHKGSTDVSDDEAYNVPDLVNGLLGEKIRQAPSKHATEAGPQCNEEF